MAPEIGLKRDVEHLHKNFADVMPHPLLEDIDEEAAILFASDGALGYEVSGLRVEQALAAGLLAPALVGDINRFFRGALHDRNKLHPLRMHLVAEKTIDGSAMLLIGGINCAQNVELDSVLTQVCPALHHAIKGSFLTAVHPVRVVNLARPINA